MKVTLVATHQITKTHPTPLYSALGVLALAAAVKQRQYECEVIDLVRYNKVAEHLFEPMADEIAEKLLETKPDIIGFSTITDNLIIALELAKRVKKMSPGICIIMGGPGVSYCSQDVLENFPAVNYIIRGEADYAFPDFLSAYEAKDENPQIKGLVYHNGDTMVDLGWPDPVEDLDQLPIPAYEFCTDIEFETSWYDHRYGFLIEAGRGCPYNCSFCSSSFYFKRKYRVKSIERLVKEIHYLRGKIKNKRARFIHDLLTFKQDYMEKLCEALTLEFPDLKWGCDSRLDTIDPPLIEKMVKSGCDFIFLGIEAATPRMQKNIGKRLDLSRIDTVLESFKKWKIKFIFSFVVGLPEEDESDIRAIFKLAFKTRAACGNNCTVQLHPLIPELGSSLFPEDLNDIVYDVNHRMVENALPFHWTELRKIVQKHPGIFPSFYRLKKTLGNYSSPETDPSKFAHFTLILQEGMINSLLFAYRVLGDEQLAKVIFECMDEFTFADMDTREEAEFNDIFTLIRTRTANLIGENEENKRLVEVFKSLATFEMAVYKIRQKESSEYIEQIDVSYSEEEMLFLASNPDAHEDVSPRQRRLMILWDKGESNIKCVEVSLDMQNLANI
ncbi:MAG: radical SAM protein [Leptospirales bacterium]